MDMGMEPELLIPGMQHGEETEFRAEVFRIASDFEKCFRTGAEQQIVDDFLILQSQWRELRRKGEDHMDVARGEKFSLTCGDPSFADRGLTLRAVSTAAASILRAMKSVSQNSGSHGQVHAVAALAWR